MTTNKPEVFRFDCHGHSAPAYSCNKPADNSGEYVRLSDYEALQADYEKLQSEMATVKKVAYGNVELLDQVEALQAECEKLRKDAERYRWLRAAHATHPVNLTICSVTDWGLEPWSGDDPDAAIDAAMEATQ